MIALRAAVDAALRAYAAALFCSSPRVGAWFALFTWCSPRIAGAGLLGLAASALWGKLLSLSTPGAPHLMNGLLTGLFLGAFHALDWQLGALLALVTLFATLASHWLSGALWRGGKLPVLSLPFVLACWVAALASPLREPLPALLLPAAGASGIFPFWVDGFFVSLGWLFFLPYPLVGALFFVGLIAGSRYLALLAIAGYVAGQLALALFGRVEPDPYGFNFMLAAMALGGIFTVPGRAAFLLAATGGALAAWITLALQTVLEPQHLPLLTLPYLAAVYVCLGALAGRLQNRSPQLVLDRPDSPEHTAARARLALARQGPPGSVALVAPFHGEWRVCQSFGGRHTHRGAWSHALDVEIVQSGRNRRGASSGQADYYCFGAPVLAPAAAQVVRLRDELPDMAPGSVDIENNWGNFLLLRTAAAEHILLAHLRRGSLRVRAGEWVVAGQPLAACGSSGRAPEPHLHLHAQSTEELGSATRPFHLVSVLVRRPSGEREFHLQHVPPEGALIAAAPRDEGIAAALRLPAEGALAYRMREASPTRIELRSERTLLGQSRMVSSSGASTAFEETPYVIGYFDRQGARDPLLDLWALALGLTPLSAAANTWQDKPPVGLLPLGWPARATASLLRPLGGYCTSRYTRAWDDAAHAWQQGGTHCFRPLPGITWRATTTAWIAPHRGVIRLRIEMFGRVREAQLESVTAVANQPAMQKASP